MGTNCTNRAVADWAALGIAALGVMSQNVRTRERDVWEILNATYNLIKLCRSR